MTFSRYGDGIFGTTTCSEMQQFCKQIPAKVAGVFHVAVGDSSIKQETSYQSLRSKFSFKHFGSFELEKKILEPWRKITRKLEKLGSFGGKFA
jgi:hypothetical protein